MKQQYPGNSRPNLHAIRGYATQTDSENIHLHSYVLEVRTSLSETSHTSSTKRLCQMMQDMGRPNVADFQMPAERDVQELIYDTEATPGVSGMSVYPDRIHINLTESGAADWPNIGPAIEYHVGSLVLSRQPDFRDGVSLPSGYIITR